MATFEGVSVRGLAYVGETGAGENLVIIYDKASLSLQRNQLKGTLLIYQRPTYVPAELSAFYVAHVGLYYGASSVSYRRTVTGIVSQVLVDWKVSGIEYRIDTGFSAE